MTADHPRVSLRSLSKHVQVVPAMMEDSPALMACVACCVDAQKRSVTPSSDGQKMDLELYQTALSSLRDALDASGGMNSTANLLATVMMHRLEVRQDGALHRMSGV